MRIVSVAARTVRWAIDRQGAARGRSERAAVILEVRSERGTIGLGEAAALPGMSIDTLDDARRAVAELAARAPFVVPDRETAFAIAATAARAGGTSRLADHDLARVTVGSPAPAARFAIETALLDALARERGISLAALLRSPVAPDPATARAHVGTPPNAAGNRGTLAGAELSAQRDPRIPLSAVVDDPDAARRAFAAGIRCFKIKVGADDDLDRVLAIASAAPGATLRIDANRSWPRAEAAGRLAALAALASLPIEYVEEPCADAHRLLSAPLSCKLALDESLAMLAQDELEAALHSPQLAAVVLKPTLLGGLSTALALAERARRAGVAAIVSHGLEGPIGTAACAELALALGGDRAVGLSRHAAIAGWLVDVDQIAADHVHPAARPGLGFAEIDLANMLATCTTAIDAEGER